MLTIPADAPIDLQLHTIHSDGQWRPDDLADYLAEHRFRVAAVTDHDTVAHIEEMQSLGAERGVHIIAATEITTRWRGHPAHLLCYARRFAGKALAELARTIQAGQLANTLAVRAELLHRGYAIPREADKLAKQGGQQARPIDNAHLLVEYGHAPDMRHALERIREAGYVQVTAPIAQAVAAAHASGAVAVLAHPGRGGGEIHRYDPDLVEAVLTETPLDGIEVYYPLHTAEQVGQYEMLARKHHLLVSAGSDSHGPRQRYPIAYEARQCVALLARCGVEVDGRDTNAAS